MYRVGILLCIVAIGLHIVTGDVTTTPGPPPSQLKYSCDNSGTVTIPTGQLESYSSIYARGKVQGSDGDCTVQDMLPAARFKISGCDADAPITAVILKIPSQNPTLGVGGQASSAVSGPFLIGGFGIAAYSLMCNIKAAIDDVEHKLPSALEFTKIATLPITSTLSTKAAEYYTVIEMSILKNGGGSLTPTEKIILGDPLLVLISGPGGPKYFVKECKAYEPTTKDKNFIQLISNGHETNANLMTGFMQAESNLCSPGKACQQSTIYAFHFKDKKDVTLECTIEVCNGPNVADCKPKRKRREADSNAADVRTLTYAITVYDSQQNERTSATAGSGKYVMTFGVMLAFAAFTWISK